MGICGICGICVVFVYFLARLVLVCVGGGFGVGGMGWY